MDLIHFVKKPFIKIAVLDQSMLHHLCKPTIKLSVVQCAKHRNIHINQLRHIKCTNHILIAFKINTCFSTNAGITLCQQCCGNLDKIHPPQIGCCCISCDITGHTTAKCDQQIFAVKLLFNQKTINISDSIQCFIFFSCWKSIHNCFQAEWSNPV